MKAAQLFVKALENEGVEYIFGIPGEENIDVMDALLDSPIKFVTVHHEQGAAFMADVYGRLTGRAGVCLSTLGPGATNLITGVADANMDRAPIVAIAGQGATTRLHKESHQILDQVNLFQPITKYATQILEPEIVAEVVRKAFKVAQTEKPGAAFIDFPENVAEMEVGDKKPIPSTIVVKINGVARPSNEWFYESSTNSVVFNDGFAPRREIADHGRHKPAQQRTPRHVFAKWYQPHLVITTQVHAAFGADDVNAVGIAPIVARDGIHDQMRARFAGKLI